VTREVVDGLEGGDGAFVARIGADEVRARKVLLATGTVDKEPEMPDLRAAIDAGAVRLCPICDGHEVIDRKVAVYGPAREALSHAVFMRTFTSDVTLLVPRGDAPVDGELRARAAVAGIAILEEAVSEVTLTPDRKAGVRLADGAAHRFDTLYPALGVRNRSELAVALGARCSGDGDLEVDRHQRTTVPGLYAAGDVVSALNQLSVAVGHAAIAATAIHNALPTAPAD
jgi:thioredoxin reductase (NADPH)